MTQRHLPPNNILYLPRGFVHYAKTSATSSLHLTIGVKGQNWSEFMRQQIDKAAREHPELRQSMRPDQILRGQTLSTPPRDESHGLQGGVD